MEFAVLYLFFLFLLQNIDCEYLLERVQSDFFQCAGRSLSIFD